MIDCIALIIADNDIPVFFLDKWVTQRMNVPSFFALIDVHSLEVDLNGDDVVLLDPFLLINFDFVIHFQLREIV